MIERGYTEKRIRPGLTVMLILDVTRMLQITMRETDRFRMARSPGCEIEGRIVADLKRHLRRGVIDGADKIFIKHGEVGADVSGAQKNIERYVQLSLDGLNPFNELRAKQENPEIGKLCASQNHFRFKAKVEGNSPGACTQYSEVCGQPFQAVHQQLADPFPLGYAGPDQRICEPV